MKKMVLFKMFYCPEKKKNIVHCAEDCRYWKKNIGCTYKDKTGGN